MVKTLEIGRRATKFTNPTGRPELIEKLRSARVIILVKYKVDGFHRWRERRAMLLYIWEQFYLCFEISVLPIGKYWTRRYGQVI